MRIVLGLGNPGRRHRRDRHNVGAMVVDRIAERYRVALDRVAHNAKVGEIDIAGERVLLMKPQTYMNLSGEAAASAARYYHVGVEQFVAIYDDMDLPVGRIRVRRDGGAAGHRGVTSLIEHLGDRQFSRVRLGVGRPPAGQEPAEFVLSSFSEAEWTAVDASIGLAAEAVEVLISDGPERAMNRYNVSTIPEALRSKSNGTEGAAGSGQGAGGASTGGRVT
jgi:PTH1 family peptidyl-tRNA hydrolase